MDYEHIGPLLRKVVPAAVELFFFFLGMNLEALSRVLFSTLIAVPFMKRKEDKASTSSTNACLLYPSQSFLFASFRMTHCEKRVWNSSRLMCKIGESRDPLETTAASRENSRKTWKLNVKVENLFEGCL